VKIVLIMPRGALYRREKGVFRRPIRYAPLTLTTLAALVPPEIGAEIEIIDEGVQSLPDDIQADLVGITAITGTSVRAYAIADRLRAKGIPVIIGGVHATLNPEEASQHADAVVTGFAEQSWPQLLRDFTAKGKMDRLYRQSPDFVLSGFPVARRDLLKRRGYITVHTMQATRGCINQCDFCIVPVAWGQKMYLRPVKEVVEELAQIGSRDVLFVDVSPIEDKRYAKELYRAMIPLKMRWMSPSTMKMADDDELLELAARSGCKGLLVGFESVSQQTLKGMGKAFNYVDKYRNQVQKLHEHGIAIQACFVFGFDTDDKSVFERTVEFADKLRLDLPRYTVYTPFPGTPIFRKLDDEHRIVERNWSFYDAQHVVFQPKLMSPGELQQGLYWAWENSYTAGSMFRRLSGAHCLLQYAIPANLAYRFYGHSLRNYSREMMTDNSSVFDTALRQGL
jgi:radical SAM superfamily enzyme YgiQ (UPF0313 family)